MALAAGCSVLHPESAASPSASPTPTASTPTPTPRPPVPMDGGTINLTMRPAVTLNPLMNEDESVDAALKLIFEPLMKIDGNFKPQPNIADIEMRADGMSDVITLADGVVWSDGTPVTTADIDYSLTVLRDDAPDNAIYKQDMKNIASWAIIDDKSIIVNFLETFGGQEYMFNFPVIPAYYYENNPDADMNPMGDGVYKFESYTVQKEMILVKNDAYWGQKPYLATLHFILTPDKDTALNSFEQGLVDALPADISDWGRFLGRFQGGNANVDEYDTLYFDFIGFNFNNPYLKNKNVRQAVCQAIDADALVSGSYLNHALRAYA
ncbi:MAG: ABC transporter substrate-binding protein, partial [Defluviitaleaceae bacterium]|nr:ABC transporter substrate-binding protein [Defluviitaleaceae bacterium]